MTNDITTGGCYPPTWPRPPKPPVPEPEPDSLDEQVDWMTYSHPELYSMVHNGLDLTGAMATSAKWARLGDELADIGDELTRLMNATSQAWQGESAELARESVAALADWSRETGTRATEVSGCITIQVDNATTARNSMPSPPYQPDMPSMQSAFTSGDLGTAAPLVSDTAVFTKQERALHQQAASTMQQFQQSSRDVYATVPQFAPPNLRRTPRGGPPPEQPPPPPAPQPPVPSPVPGGTPRPGGPGPAGGPGVRATPGPATPGTATPRPAGPLPPGGGSGTAEPTPARPAAAASAAGRPGTGGPGMSGVPMGGPQGQGTEDTEHRSKYSAGEDDLWGLEDQMVMPPVIGEVNRRA
jgi:PPE family